MAELSKKVTIALMVQAPDLETANKALAMAASGRKLTPEEELSLADMGASLKVNIDSEVGPKG